MRVRETTRLPSRHCPPIFPFFLKKKKNCCRTRLVLLATPKNDEAWEGRIQSSSLRISQVVEIVAGCAVTVSRLPTPAFAPASPGPGREVRSWIGSTRRGKIARLGVWFFRGALQGEGFFCTLCSWRLGQERIVPHSVVGPPTFFVFLFIFVWARHGCRATNWRAVLAGRCSLDSGRLVC